MLIARPTALTGIFDVLNELPGAELADGTRAAVVLARRGCAASRWASGWPLNRIPVRPNDIALFAEPAAPTG